jgi:hypothetical protein
MEFAVPTVPLRSTPVLRHGHHSNPPHFPHSSRETMLIRAKIIISAISLSSVALTVFGASRSLTQTLLVQVRPEAALSYIGNDIVLLRIRLAPGARASIWKAESCEKPVLKTSTVSQSGIRVFPLSTIPGPPDGLICLTTSDGSIAVTLQARRHPPPKPNLPPI